MPMENADATAIWQNVLAGLNARRKKVVVACVNRALPYRIADNQFLSILIAHFYKLVQKKMIIVY